MEAKEFGEYLKSVRKEKRMTIRQLELYSKVSNAYISQLERGDRGLPSPEILKKLSQPLGVDYNELMVKAGYVEETKKESVNALPESRIEQIINETEAEFNVNLRDDPIVENMVRQILRSMAESKKRD